MKPVETGVGPDGPRDAIALREAAGGADPLDLVCPQRFALPAAPAVAAASEGRNVDLGAIREAFARLAARHEHLVVEGAGGLLVPLGASATMADLAGELGLALLVVARSRLGTINHTLLSLEVARARGLALAGVVVSHADGEISGSDRENLDWLRRYLGSLWLGEVPYLGAGGGRRREAPQSSIDIDALLGAAAAPGYPRPGAA
jgi:dethiobiotin synthetase